MKQGFAFWCFDKLLETKELFQEAAKIGFKGVDLLPEKQIRFGMFQRWAIRSFSSNSASIRVWFSRWFKPSMML